MRAVRYSSAALLRHTALLHFRNRRRYRRVLYGCEHLRESYATARE